ncbi:MAG TPA: hypothetical protein VHC95_10435 [Opitutales bacterium]|nr:hypothetical protein [Opitutales bacterium]
MNQHELAQAGLGQIKSAILGFLETQPHGASNAEIAEALGLRSDYEGEQKDYLCWSILGLLVNEGKIRYETPKNRKIYFLI